MGQLTSSRSAAGDVCGVLFCQRFDNIFCKTVFSWKKPNVENSFKPKNSTWEISHIQEGRVQRVGGIG